MARCLLLVDRDIGQVVAIADFLVTGGLAVTEAAQLQVTSATVNGNGTGDAASTLRRAGGIAACLYARVYRRRWMPLKLIDIKVQTAALSAPYSGPSGELLYALMTFIGMCEEFEFGWSESLRHVSFAATGRLGDEGGRQECDIKWVAGVRQKIAAALDSGALPPGSLLFYPKENQDEVTPDLTAKARMRSIHLRPVARLEEALHYLGLRRIPQRALQQPYRGEQVFRLQDEGIFFGRDAQRMETVGLLRQQKISALGASSPRGVACLVHARSSAGKSSFLRAGVLADLIAEGREEGVETLHALWQLPSNATQAQTLTEQDLFASIVESWAGCGPADSGPSDARDLGEGFLRKEELAQIGAFPDLADRLRSATAGSRLVWTVDSLERILSPEVTRPAQLAFARFLQQLLWQGVWILAAIRTKHLPSLKAWTDDRRTPVFAHLFEGRTIELRPMERAELESTVVGPAWFAGASFEVRGTKALDQQIKEQVEGDAMLPWLSIAMSDLWDRSVQAGGSSGIPDSVALKFDAFEGLSSRMAAEAQAVHASMPDDGQRSLKQLLFALAEPGELAGHERARTAQFGGSSSVLLSPLANALLMRKVLVESSRGDVLELRVASATLFATWPTARDLLLEFRSLRRLVSNLRQQAEAHFGPAGGGLLGGQQLKNALARERDLDLFSEAGLLRRYLRRSQQAAQVKLILLGLTGAAALIGGTSFTLQRWEAERARLTALQETAAQLVSSYVSQGRPDLALDKAARIILDEVKPESLIPRLEVALLSAHMADLEWWRANDGASRNDAALREPIAADVGSTCNGEVLGIAPESTRRWQLMRPVASGSARAAAGEELVLCSGDGGVVHRIRIGTRMTHGAFDQNGLVMATLSDSGTSHVWRLSETPGTAPLALPLIRHGAAKRMLEMKPRWALSPNGLWLAVATSDGRLEVCSLKGHVPICRNERLVKATDGGDTVVVFNPRGDELVAVYSPGEGASSVVAQRWALSTPGASKSLTLDLAWPEKPPAITFSSDGNWTALLVGKRELQLLKKNQTRPVRLGVDKDILSVSFEGSPQTLNSTNSEDLPQALYAEFSDGESRRWNVRSAYGTTPYLDEARAAKVFAEFAIDGDILYVRNSVDAEPEIWQVKPPRRLMGPNSGGRGGPEFEPSAQPPSAQTRALRNARCIDTAAPSALAGARICCQR
jgi:hypothetical protein